MYVYRFLHFTSCYIDWRHLNWVIVPIELPNITRWDKIKVKYVLFQLLPEIIQTIWKNISFFSLQVHDGVLKLISWCARVVPKDFSLTNNDKTEEVPYYMYLSVPTNANVHGKILLYKMHTCTYSLNLIKIRCLHSLHAPLKTSHITLN